MDYNKMTHDELYQAYRKIVHIEKVKNDLLFNELDTLDEHINKITDFNGCITFMENTFKRYPPMIANAQLEDDEWTFHDNSNKQVLKYPLMPNEVIYENSVKSVHKMDLNTKNYLLKMNKYFNNYIDRNKFKIILRIIDWTDNICWVVFKLTNNSQMIKNS